MGRKISKNWVKKLTGKKFHSLRILLDKAILMRIKQGKKSHIDSILACMIKSDEKKLEAIKIFKDDFDKKFIARTLESDEKKLEVVKHLNDEAKVDVIETLKSDEIKLQAISIMVENHLYEWDIIKVLKTLSNDRERLKLLQFNLVEDKVRFVACSLKIFDYLELDSINAKYLLLNEFLDEYYSNNTYELYEFINKAVKQIKEIQNIQNQEEKLRKIDTIKGDFCKSEIIRSLDDDNEKVNNLYKLKDDVSKCNVAISIKDDTLKLKAISMIKDSYDKILVIKSLNNIEDKIKAFSTIEDKRYCMEFFTEELSDEEKVQVLKVLRRGKTKEDYIITNCIYSIQDDNLRLEAVMQSCDFQQLGEFINNQRLGYMFNENFKRLKSIYNKIEEAIESNNDELKVDMIRKINQKYLQLNIINSILDGNKKIEMLMGMDLNKDEVERYRSDEDNVSFLMKNIEAFMEMEKVTNTENKANIIKELYKKNNDVVKNIDFRILDEKYIQLLGMEKINLISCYEEIQKKILELDDNQLIAFSRCIRNDIKQEEQDTWTIYADEILDNILDKQYKELIYEISKEKRLVQEDYEKLRLILQNKNIYNIKNMRQVRMFDKIMKEKMESIMNDENKSLKLKKDALIQKIFGHDLSYAEKIISKYGEDVNSINDEDIKSYIKALNLIMKVTDAVKLKEIFSICNEIKTDKGTIELKIKDEYRKMLNDDLYFPKKEDLVDENVYEAGVNFKIIMTSVGAYSRETMNGNYKDDWNRPTIQSQHMCTSYIRNDMIGMAPVHDICYGFNNMQENSLMLAGNTDIVSYTNTLVSKSRRGERYYAPDNLVNNTKRYNELCYRRIQKGKKKQPDYIIVFRKDGTIKNMENAKKASRDFENLPIVIIDIDKCLENEKKQVEQMCKEYKENPNSYLFKQIKQKIRNNRVTNPNFGHEFDQIIRNSNVYSKNDISSKNEKENKYLTNIRKSKESRMQNLCKQIETIVRDDER